MILVDTSVLIDFLKGIDNAKSGMFETVLEERIPYGFSSYTYQEILQGSRNESEFNKLKEYLSSQVFYFLPESLKTYDEAARMFFNLRRQGITVRSSIDILIALTAIKNNLFLLHNDRDFDVLALKLPTLKILNCVH